jgi:hypothetical protein
MLADTEVRVFMAEITDLKFGDRDWLTTKAA